MGEIGIVRYYGPVLDQENECNNMWLGVEFETEIGDSDGKIKLPDGTDGGWDAGHNFASFVHPNRVHVIQTERLVKRVAALNETKRVLNERITFLENTLKENKIEVTQGE